MFRETATLLIFFSSLALVGCLEDPILIDNESSDVWTVEETGEMVPGTLHWVECWEYHEEFGYCVEGITETIPLEETDD